MFFTSDDPHVHAAASLDVTFSPVKWGQSSHVHCRAAQASIRERDLPAARVIKVPCCFSPPECPHRTLEALLKAACQVGTQPGKQGGPGPPAALHFPGAASTLGSAHSSVPAWISRLLVTQTPALQASRFQLPLQSRPQEAGGTRGGERPTHPLTPVAETGEPLATLPCVHLTQPSGAPGDAVVKNLPANAGDTGDVGSIPASGRSPGEGNGNPLQYSCLENPMDPRHDEDLREPLVHSSFSATLTRLSLGMCFLFP